MMLATNTMIASGHDPFFHRNTIAAHDRVALRVEERFVCMIGSTLAGT